MSVVDFLEVGEKVSVISKIVNNQVEVYAKSQSGRKSIYFACYLYFNDELAFTSTYNRTGVFKFNCTPNNSARISIRIYLKDNVSDVREGKSVSIGYIHIESTYTNNLIKKTFSKGNSELGQLLIVDNKLKLSNFEAIQVDEDSLYHLDPFNNRTWQWCLQQLMFIPYIISYYELISKDVAVLHKMLMYIKSWNIYKNSEKAIENHMLWHDHATALRLKNLTISLCFLLKNEIITMGSEDYHSFIDLIKLHIDILYEDSFYSKHTNHGFDQALFLYHAALEFQNLTPDMRLVVKKAEQRLIDEINYAFCVDGGHKENSPAYLNFGIKQCLMAIEISQSYGHIKKLKGIQDILENATKALIYTVKPDGYLPLVGDTSTFKVTDFFSRLKPDCYREFKYALTQGKVGGKPKSNKLILSKTGYAYYRSNWEKEGFMDAIHLGFKACFHSNYHRHDDDLSITLYGYGQDWLIDGGIYKYEEKNPHRRYIRSHLSHNILSPNNAIALRDKDNRHEVFLTELSGLDGDDFHVLGKSKMFMDYVNTREIKVLCENSFTVKDKCINISNEKFDATSRLFFPNSIDIEIKNNTIIAKGKNKHLFIEVSTHSDISINLKLNPKEKIVGWLSDSTNVLKQTNLVEITTSENAQQDISIEMKFIFK